MSKFLVKLLADNSFNKYWIHFKVYLANHFTQGAIALYRLGASEERITSFADWYFAQYPLEPKEAHEETDAQSQILLGEEAAFKLLGKRTNYYHLLQFYQDQLQQKRGHDNALAALVADRLPTLMQGHAGAALHGMIQTGYGFSIGNEAVVVEGLAWMHYAYMPLCNVTDAELTAPLDGTAFGVLEPTALLSKVREDEHIQRVSLEGRNAVRKELASGFGQRVKPLLDEGRSVFQLVMELKTPFEPGAKLTGAIVGNALVNLAITVYLASELRNEFFLLHGVTGSWSLRQLLPSVSKEGELLKTYRCFLATLICVYVAEGCPRLREEYLNANHDADSTGAAAADTSWEEIKRKVFAENHDEHILKLVQVCHDMSIEMPENETLYKLAALCALRYELHFPPKPEGDAKQSELSDK